MECIGGMVGVVLGVGNVGWVVLFVDLSLVGGSWIMCLGLGLGLDKVLLLRIKDVGMISVSRMVVVLKWWLDLEEGSMVMVNWCE